MTNDFKSQIFEENIELLKRQCPEAALKVQREDFDLKLKYLTEKDQIFDKRDGKIWFTQGELKSFSSIEPQSENVIIYGLGSGRFFEAYQVWLEADPRRSLIIIEDDLEVFKLFLSQEKSKDSLSSHQVFIRYMHESQVEREQLLWSLTWYMLSANPHFIVSEPYKKNHLEKAEQIHQCLIRHYSSNAAIASEYMDFSKEFYPQFYLHLLQLEGKKLFNPNFTGLNHLPWIICGAGPSLQEERELNWWQDRAVVIAAGSGVNSLFSMGVYPHFGGGMDPFISQWWRLRAHGLVELPYFYKMRWNQRANQQMGGPKVLMGGSGGYPITQTLLKDLGIYAPEIEEGYNIVNLMMGAARAIGVKDLVIAGVDLALCPDGKVYGNSSYDDDETRTMLSHKGSQSQVITSKGVDGNEVKTYFKWLNEAAWISAFSSSCHPMKITRCGSRGLFIENLPHRTFQELKTKKDWIQRDISNTVWQVLNSCDEVSTSKDQLSSELKSLKESLERVMESMEVWTEKACEFFTSLEVTLNDFSKIEENGRDLIPPDTLISQLNMEESLIEAEVSYEWILKDWVLFRKHLQAKEKELLERFAAKEVKKELIHLWLSWRVWDTILKGARQHHNILNHAIEGKSIEELEAIYDAG